MIWLISKFPELDQLNPAERAEMLRRVPRWTYPRLVSGGIGVGAIAGLVTAYGVHLHDHGRPAVWAAGVVVGALAGVVTYLLELRKIRKSMRKLIGRVRGQHPPFCPYCGHDLRASPSDTCSKCGRVVTYAPSSSKRLSRFTGRLVGAWLNKKS
jgi:hypothetical protein